MLKKLISLLVITTVLATSIIVLPVSAAAAPTFGTYAGFENLPEKNNGDELNGLKLEPNFTTAWNSHPSHITINGATYATEGGAEDNGAYIKLGSDGNVELISPVEAGCNYVVSFYSKSNAEISMRMENTYFKGSGYSITETVTLPSTGWTEIVEPGYYRSQFGYKSDRVHEYQSKYMFGGNTPNEWVKNSFEFHVPAGMGQIKFTISAQANITDDTRALDNFTIEKVDTNLVVNGDFDYTADVVQSGDGKTGTTAYSYNGMYYGADAPTGWFNYGGDSSYRGRFYYDTEEAKVGNNSYCARPYWYGCEFQQPVFLGKGTYKLSYRRKQNSNASGLGGMVSLRLGNKDDRTYTNEPERIDKNVVTDGSHLVPPAGTTFYPRKVGSDQVLASGWVNYELYFDVTTDGINPYWLSFGSYDNTSWFIIDDVVLLPVEDADVQLVSKDIEIVDNETKEFTWAHATAPVDSYAKLLSYKVNPVTEITNGSKFKALLGVNNGATPINGDYIAAIYEQTDNGKPILRSVNHVPVTQGNPNEVSLTHSNEITIPANGNCFVKFFVWDSISDPKPLTDVFVFGLE